MLFFFFFQAEDGIRAGHVTGVQTCALPISAMEELLYVVEGRVEQWVGREKRELGPGEGAHVPVNEVHGSYNVFAERAVFLAVLSPAVFEGPALIDVSGEEPWRSLEPKAGRGA